MKQSGMAICGMAALLLGSAVGIVWFHPSSVDLADDGPLPAAPTVPASASPVLISASALPVTERPIVAKPVIAAVRGALVVLSQEVALRESRIVQWQCGPAGDWAEARPLKNWPATSHFVGDPWMEPDHRGNLFLVHTCLEGMRLTVRNSTDAGQTWSAGSEVIAGADRPVLGVSPDGRQLVIAASIGERADPGATAPLDASDPQFAAKLAAAVRFSTGVFRSTNRGRSWSRLPGPLPGSHAIPFSVIIDDDGAIASSWIAASGQTLSAAPAASRSVVCASGDHGRSWVETVLVPDLQPDRDHPFNGERFPVLAAGAGGRVQVAFVVDLARRVVVRQCTKDQWSDPIVLSSESAEEVRMPAIATLGAMVHVTWMERRGGRWQMFYRGSRNNGESWSDALLLSAPDRGSTLIDEQGFTITSDDDQTCLRDDGLGTVHAVWGVGGTPPEISGRIWHAAIAWRSDSEDGDERQTPP